MQRAEGCWRAYHERTADGAGQRHRAALWAVAPALVAAALLDLGEAAGAVIVVLAATLGSLIVFLAARYAIGDLLYKKAGPFVRRMEEGFRKNAFSYLMFLRLVPLFPFWLVNLVPAFLNVSATAFVVAGGDAVTKHKARICVKGNAQVS